MLEGDEVTHRRFGRGTVIWVDQAHRKVRVSFDEVGMDLTLLEDDLLTIKSAVARPHSLGRVLPPTKVMRKGTDGSTRAKILVDCLRLGIVPRRHADKITVDRERELAELDQAFQEAMSGGAVRVVTGVNGSGKSHFLSIAMQKALERNFLVLASELQDVDPYKPREVYHELVTHIHLRSRDGVCALRHLLENVRFESGSETSTTMRRSKVFSPILEVMLSGSQADSDFWSYVEGEETYIHDVRDETGERLIWLPNHSTVPQLYCHMLNVIAKLALDNGYSGTMFVVDESEFVHYQTYGNYCKCADLLEGLRFTVLGDRSGLREEELQSGGYSTISDIEYSPFPDSNIFLLVSYTTRGDDVSFYEDTHFLRDVFSPGEEMTLSDLTRPDVRELVTRLQSIYNKAYDLDIEIPTDTLEELAEDAHYRHSSGLLTVRAIIQSVIESLDLTRHYDEESVGGFVKQTMERV